MRNLVFRLPRLNPGCCNLNRNLASAPSSQDEVYVEKLSGPQEGLAFLTMNRPQGKNSFSRHFLGQFEQCLQSLTNERNVRVLILRSLVPGVFCAGADLKERQVHIKL